MDAQGVNIQGCVITVMVSKYNYHKRTQFQTYNFETIQMVYQLKVVDNKHT